MLPASTFGDIFKEYISSHGNPLSDSRTHILNINKQCSFQIETNHPLDETHLDAVRGLIQTKRFRPSASTKRAQLSVAATTVRSTDLFNIMSSPESTLIRQD